MEVYEKIELEIKDICDEGDVFIEMGEFENAYENFMEALELVPDPKESYFITASIMAGLGDVYFKSGNFQQAKQVLSDAMHCAGAIGSPYLHFRLGQCQLELGNEERAADELCRAYMGAGKEIFETDHPKYFEFLKTKIVPPANGEW
ncbi:tetratricopeptide repeat protein [Shewanella sp. A3A]|nr:tetratricopeptide repeat protein [Shewanella ferrihydritica]